MRIVCLAWGSLVWKPGVLPVVGEWRRDGPSLPIEFARVGEQGELATVMCPRAPMSPVRWADLDVEDLVLARRLLRQREGIPTDRIGGVGTVVVDAPSAGLAGAAEILRWANAREGIEAVIWTALPPRFAKTEGRSPAPAEAARYLRALTGPARAHAEDYVRRTPEEIRTPNREALERVIES